MLSELEAIKRLFREQRDPIGVGRELGALDEYNSYALEAFNMLHRGAGCSEIARYLEWAEVENMGFDSSGKATKIAAQVLTIHEAKRK
jgi:hypothetical protein